MRTTDLFPDLQLETLHYPIAPAVQQETIALWRTEWARTDYDWIEALNGDYSEHLVIATVLARREGRAVATATVHYRRENPDVAVLGSVLTLRAFRGAGLGGRVVSAAIDEAVAAGCAVCLLGTARNPRNVYLKHGFNWLHGTAMSRDLRPDEAAEKRFFPGQQTRIRVANWGDLPGLALLAMQPLATRCFDYPRGLFSGRYLPAERCLSNFPVLWSETVTKGGSLLVVEGAVGGRILGFGSVTPNAGVGRRHVSTLDFVVHDSQLDRQAALVGTLLEAARAAGAQRANAWVLAADEGKRSCLLAAGFGEAARFLSAVRLTAGAEAVVVLERAL